MEKTTIKKRKEVLSAIIEQYQLPLRGTHGVAHWARVLEQGIRLAHASGVDERIVEVFALLHDVAREHEDQCSRHGQRATKFFAKHRDLFQFNPSDWYALVAAMAEHTGGKRADDPRIAVCWDADRLDFWRIGIMPDPAYMTTAIAKRIASSKSFQQECAERFNQREDETLPAWVSARWPELAAAW